VFSDPQAKDGFCGQNDYGGFGSGAQMNNFGNPGPVGDVFANFGAGPNNGSQFQQQTAPNGNPFDNFGGVNNGSNGNMNGAQGGFTDFGNVNHQNNNQSNVNSNKLAAGDFLDFNLGENNQQTHSNNTNFNNNNANK